MKARSFHIETFGCQMNEHDSEKIRGLLCHRGMVPVVSSKEADLVILNTCSVREKAAQKVYSRLGEIKHRKRSDSKFLIGVVGCVAQQESEEMARKAPFVDLVLGTHMYHAIPDLLDEIEQSGSAQAGAGVVETRFLEDPVPVEIEARARGNSFRANITIMEGCNKHCSFCIVPFTRGKERNRPAWRILEEAERAVDDGFREILLLGQTVNAYRNPQRPRDRFARLLDDVSSIRGLQRLRFTSPHPREFDDETIAVIGQSNVICNQVHLPVQSGSDRVLGRMRRQYTRDRFLDLVEKFNRCGRQIAFSTDVIVGFPEETEEDFQLTLSLVEAVGFESMFSFKYSPRPHTEAERWEDDVPDSEKTRRLMLLQRLQRGIQLRLNRERYLGRTFEVLVEGPARDRVHIFGRTTSNRVVNFPGSEKPGSLVAVRVVAAGPNSVNGEQLAAAAVG